MAPVLILDCLLAFGFVFVNVVELTSAEAILTALLYLIESVFTACYWVGLLNVYDFKRSVISSSKPSAPPTLQPATFYNSGDQDFNIHLFSETNFPS